MVLYEKKDAHLIGAPGQRSIPVVSKWSIQTFDAFPIWFPEGPKTPKE